MTSWGGWPPSQTSTGPLLLPRCYKTKLRIQTGGRLGEILLCTYQIKLTNYGEQVVLTRLFRVPLGKGAIGRA